MQPDEDAARLAQGVLVRADLRDLRADVEVQHLEAAEHALRAEELRDLDDLRRGETELGAIPRRVGPPPGAPGGQAAANPDVRADSELLRGLEQQRKLVRAIQHDHGHAAETLRQERGLDIGAVLVAVAHDQRVGSVEQGQRDQQLRLAAHLETQIVGATRLDQLLHHLPLLVGLDGIDRPVVARLRVLAPRGREAAHQLVDAARQDVGEANQERRVQTAVADLLHQLPQVDPSLAAPVRVDGHVAGRADREVPPAPVVDGVELGALVDGPVAHS